MKKEKLTSLARIVVEDELTLRASFPLLRLPAPVSIKVGPKEPFRHEDLYASGDESYEED